MKLHHNTIQNYTGLSKAEYEVLLVETLMMCLSKVSKTPQHLQLLLVDKRINNWFLKQISKANQDYIKKTEPYKNLPKEVLRKAYLDFLKMFTKHYPKALVKNVKILNVQPFSIRHN